MYYKDIIAQLDRILKTSLKNDMKLDMILDKLNKFGKIHELATATGTTISE